MFYSILQAIGFRFLSDVRCLKIARWDAYERWSWLVSGNLSLVAGSWSLWSQLEKVRREVMIQRYAYHLQRLGYGCLLIIIDL